MCSLKVNAAILELEGMDQNVERFTKVERQMNELLRCYREIYEEKKKITTQTTLTGFFSKATPRTPTPTPTSPSISTPSSPLPGPLQLLITLLVTPMMLMTPNHYHTLKDSMTKMLI